MLQVVRNSFQLIGRERRLRWLFLMLLAVLASLLEMAGAVLVYLLVALVANPEGALTLPFLGNIERFGAGLERPALLVTVAVVMGFFFLFRATVQVAITYFQQRVAHDLGASLATRLASGYLRLPYEWHLQRNTADLIRNANAAVNMSVGQAFLPMIRVAADLIMTVGLLLIMLVISPVATAIAVTVVGGAAAVLLVVVQPRIKRLGETVHSMSRTTLKTLQQPLHGLRDVKLLGREAAFTDEYATSRNELARAFYLRGTIAELPRQVMDTALIGFILAFFGFAVATGAATQEVLSTLGLFAYAGLRLQPSLTRIVGGLNEMKYASASLEQIHHDIALVSRLTPPRDRRARPFQRDIVLDDVFFRYEGADEYALVGVDLTIGRGETIGICGVTGSGKTTLVDLVSGLLTPTRGRILIDGRDLGADVRGWQRNLGVVPQMVFITDDTLRRNIALGVPHGEIDDAAVHEAVRLAQLDEFVTRLPLGLDTPVGERGVRVSGGQRQRIAIARALYRKAEVLIFDEGTSALDNTTEAQLMEALEQLRGTHTIILVAHRLSTVRACDRIVFVEGGLVSGIADYDRLIVDNEGFRALASGAVAGVLDARSSS